MSFDRQLDQVCQHFVVEEALFFNSDRQTVVPQRPIASGVSVRVRINGVEEIFSGGSRTPAQAQGSKITPFNIQAGINDQIIINVDGGAPQTIIADDGILTATQLAASLNRSTQGAIFEAVKGRIQIRTRSDGKKSSLLVASVGSTLADVIGVPTDRLWRGKLTFPGWSLVNDPNTLADRPTRQIVFDEVMRGFADYVEIDYSTVRQECRRCGGLGVENDWALGVQSAEIVEVRDQALLLQEIQKIMFTVQGSNPFHRWYGTNLITTIGSKLSVGGTVQNILVSEIQEAFQRWQQIKKAQEEDIGQFVSDREYPFNLLKVELEQSNQDPTVVFISATIQNRSDQPIQIERAIQLPEPLDILGSTTQQSLAQQSVQQTRIVG